MELPNCHLCRAVSYQGYTQIRIQAAVNKEMHVLFYKPHLFVRNSTSPFTKSKKNFNNVL